MAGHGGVLHALGHHFQEQVPAEVHHRAHDLGRAFVGAHGADEVAVDLQGVERQAGQVRQGREAGPEVVERQTGAGFPELLQHHGGPVGIAHDVALGDLELQGAVGQPGLAQDAGDFRHQVVAVDLPGGQVDADRQLPRRAVAPAPFRQLLGRGLDHMGADLVQQAHVAGERQEVVGHDQAPARMAPADQGLEAGDGAVRQTHDRLEKGADLAALQCAPEVALQREPGQAVALQARAVSRRAAAARGLGRFHRQLGAPQQLGRFRRIGSSLGGDGADGKGGIDVEAGDP